MAHGQKDNSAGRVAPAAGASGASRLAVLAGAALVVLATLAAYRNSLDGPFIFDDGPSIVENTTIRELWPIGPVLSPPREGQAVTGRPVVNLSFAVNYALGELDVQGYHVGNLAIHVLAALVLLGLVHQTLRLPSMPEPLRGAATALATAVATLWALHPLQTESVTYVSQRAESLMGLFYLLTLYGFVRSSQSRSTFWPVAAVLACAAGMASKEVMVTAPLVVLLYDRTFLAGSFGQAMRKRWDLYLPLATTWGLLALLVLSAGSRGGTAGAGANVPDWWSYARTQPGVILHYLRLAYWPWPLCLDYGWPVANTAAQIVPGAAVLALLAAATIWGLVRRCAWAFPAACVFLILAPTSSVVPIMDLIFEHRMYLPLAAAIALTVVGAFGLWQNLVPKVRWLADEPAWRRRALPWAALVAVAGTLGCLTALRNDDYRSEESIWRVTVQASPTSFRARNNLGSILCAQGRSAEGAKLFREALAINPRDAEAYLNLGIIFDNDGKTGMAIAYYSRALACEPTYTHAHQYLGELLYGQGKFDEAAKHLRQVVAATPKNVHAHNTLGAALYAQGQVDLAIEQYRQALRIDPNNAEARDNLRAALQKGVARASRP